MLKFPFIYIKGLYIYAELILLLKGIIFNLNQPNLIKFVYVCVIFGAVYIWVFGVSGLGKGSTEWDGKLTGCLANTFGWFQWD